MSHRSHRLAEELKNEISAIIAQEVKDPRVGFATVTEVKVSPDLRHARVAVDRRLDGVGRNGRCHRRRASGGDLRRGG